MLRKVLFGIGGLIVMAVFVAAIGLGVWSFNLNKQLSQAQAANHALQAKYDALNTEYAQAKEDFNAKSTKADADLAKVNSDLSLAQIQIKSLQADLKKAQDENAKMKSSLSAIRGKVEILNTFWFKSSSSF